MLDRQALEERWRTGERPTLQFFWGHQPAKDGRITSSCFSQWWPAPFAVGGFDYMTAEHWMMAEKARAFGDDASATAILASTSPADAKRLGRKVRDFEPSEWDRRKFGIVVEGSVHKFGQNEPLREHLLSTGDAVLVEASPIDAIWGIGLSADDVRAADPGTWLGDNLLGFALMVARDRLRH